LRASADSPAAGYYQPKLWSRKRHFTWRLTTTVPKSITRELRMGDTSPASRVYDLLNSASKINDDAASLGVYPKLFALTDVKPEHLQQDLVVECLTDFRDQIRRTEQAITEQERSVAGDAIKAALAFTSFARINEGWNPRRTKHLRPEVIQTWRFLALHYREKAPEIPAEEFKALIEELTELEKAASAEGVPDELRQFIGEQIDRIRKAMRRYKIVGEVALRAAVRAGYGDAVCTLPNVDKSTPAAKDALSKLGKVWKHTASVARDAKAVHDIIALLSAYGQGIAQIASDVAQRLT
jgi:hypothetical protein